MYTEVRLSPRREEFARKLAKPIQLAGLAGMYGLSLASLCKVAEADDCSDACREAAGEIIAQARKAVRVAGDISAFCFKKIHRVA